MTVAALLLVAVLLPGLFAGTVNRVKALVAGRRGAPLLQPFLETARLLRKARVTGEVTTPLFAVGPAAALAGALAAAAVTPLPGGVSLVSFPGDALLFAGALAAGRLLAVVAALDTGSSFEGMGASRESLFGTLAEPALLLCLMALSLAGGGFTLAAMTGPFLPGLAPAAPVCGAIVLFLLLLVEGCRVPVDDPNTHLELTMIHEVTVLDHGGPDLAFSQWAAWLRMTLFASLIARLLLPLPAGAPALLAHAAAVLLVAVATGLLESSVARFRMSHVPQFILLAGSFATILLSAALLFRAGGLR